MAAPDENEKPTSPVPARLPTANEADPVEEPVTGAVPTPPNPVVVATTGRRQALRQISRELKEGDLANPGVQKLLIELLETAENKCEILEGFVARYHAADKSVAVLQEKLRTQTAIDVLFGSGLGIGSAIIGLAPYFWDQSVRGPIALGVGVLLIFGSTAAKVVKR